jgi:cytochrome c-type biogenesis protein
VSGAKSTGIGYLLILVYAAGFLLPFLLLGLFTSQVLNFLKEKKKFVKYTIKAGGVLLILMGLMTFTGYMNGISSYLNRAQAVKENVTADKENQENEASADDNSKGEQAEAQAGNEADTGNKAGAKAETGNGAEEGAEAESDSATDFTLTDQYGDTHTLSDYKGQVVFLNFYATWCPPCKKELPDIEKLYKEYGSNEKEVVFLGVTNPKSKDYPNNSDEDVDYIKSFIEKGEYTFPTVFDETGEVCKNMVYPLFPLPLYLIKMESCWAMFRG